MADDGWYLYKPPRKSDGWTQVKPRKKKAKPQKGVSVDVGSGQTGYEGLTDAEIEARANALADAQIGASRSEITRQQAAAMAAAGRDVSTLRGLGEAQMGMISKIPAQIQDIRDTAGAAMAGFGSTVAGAEGAQLTAEQAANAAFTASQVGPTAAAPPAADPGAVAAATGAIARAPADAQVEIGGASAIAAAGMPAVVARATQDQVMQRMAQAASVDADYRAQLIELAAKRGGLYADALDGLYSVEKDKFGEWEAKQRLKLDQQQLALQQRAEIANEKLAGIKTKQSQQGLDLEAGRLRLANQKEANDLQEAMAKGAKPNAALSKVYGYVVDTNGQPILNAAGQKIPVAKTSKAATGKKPAQVANTSAQKYSSKLKRMPDNSITGWHNEHVVPYAQAITQITAELVAMGIPQAQARQLATQAANTYYPLGHRGK
jgi:hypothetical protein